MNQLGGFDRCLEIVNGILIRHGITAKLYTEAEIRLIRRGRSSLRKIIFEFDPGKSFRAHIEDLLRQAETIQRNAGRTNFVGALLLHLVGAMLDLVLGPGKITHHGFTVADQPTARKADFEIDGTAIHVTTHPTEALVRKCAENLKAGLIPLIITLGSGVAGAANLLEQARLADRVDVLDSFQFFTANIYEHSLFQTSACKVTLAKLIARYNEIVTARETDPSLRIVLKEA